MRARGRREQTSRRRTGLEGAARDGAADAELEVGADDAPDGRLDVQLHQEAARAVLALAGRAALRAEHDALAGGAQQGLQRGDLGLAEAAVGLEAVLGQA